MSVDDSEDAALAAVLEREIVACDVRLRFLTAAGYDDARLERFREELLERRSQAEARLGVLRATER